MEASILEQAKPQLEAQFGKGILDTQMGTGLPPTSDRAGEISG